MKDKAKDIREYLTEQSIIAYREHVIEECARVVVARANHSPDPIELLRAASAIRALKDKP